MIFNNLKTYAIINPKKKIIETFRTKITAQQMLPKIQELHYQKLKVIKIK